tara:strand:+ start:393 stop:593 length:201 start_codon:yes stop_codon:yes gene_type:complete
MIVKDLADILLISLFFVVFLPFFTDYAKKSLKKTSKYVVGFVGAFLAISLTKALSLTVNHILIGSE